MPAAGALHGLREPDVRALCTSLVSWRAEMSSSRWRSAGRLADSTATHVYEFSCP